MLDVVVVEDAVVTGFVAVGDIVVAVEVFVAFDVAVVILSLEATETTKLISNLFFGV